LDIEALLLRKTLNPVERSERVFRRREMKMKGGMIPFLMVSPPSGWQPLGTGRVGKVKGRTATRGHTVNRQSLL
jgi:hypothetical protein